MTGMQDASFSETKSTFRHKAWLTNRESNDPLQKWFIRKDAYLIGRVEPADLILDLPRISRRHAQIERQEIGYFLVDLHSRNGTFLNGNPVGESPKRLQDGDEIVLGGAAGLRFHDPEETRAGPKLGRLRGVWINSELQRVWVDATLVDPPLSAAQFTLLNLLYSRIGQIVSRGEIVTAVWPNTNPAGISNEAVDGLIKRLRKRLREHPGQQDYLQVVRGRGVRLIQPK